MTSSKLKPILMVVSATLLFSIGAPISKTTDSSPMVLTFFRCSSGFIAFMLYGIITGKKMVPKLRPRLIIGGVMYTATSLSFYTSLKYTTAANSTVLINTSPFFLALLGFLFLHERPLKRDWLFLSLIMTGIILCFYSGISLEDSKGDLLALFAGLVFSMLAVIIKKVGAEDAMQPLLWGNLFAVMVTVPGLFKADAVVLRDIPFFVVLGFFQMAAPFLLYARGQQNLGAMEASLFKLLEPVAATVWVAILVHEIPSQYSIAGGGLVISSLFLKTFLEYWDYKKNQKI